MRPNARLLAALWTPLALAMLLSSACENPAPRASPARTGDVAARVNGAPIYEDEVQARMKGDAPHSDLTPDLRKSVLDALIVQELAAQKAKEVGLEPEALKSAEVKRLEAQLEAARRRELAQALMLREVKARAEVTDSEVQAYFAKYEGQLKKRFHVLQILRKGEGAIAEVAAQLAAGKTFEEVAEASVPANYPEDARRPYDLGELAWQQLPEQWREVVDTLPDGQVSGVIAGPRDRFWIIKIVERREDPSVTLEALKPSLTATLKNQKALAVTEETEAALKAAATVEITVR